MYYLTFLHSKHLWENTFMKVAGGLKGLVESRRCISRWCRIQARGMYFSHSLFKTKPPHTSILQMNIQTKHTPANKCCVQAQGIVHPIFKLPLPALTYQKLTKPHKQDNNINSRPRNTRQQCPLRTLLLPITRRSISSGQ